MKQPVNFRLSQGSIVTLEALTAALGISKTEIVEEAIGLYAREKAGGKHPLLEFAGILGEDDAAAMLRAASERHDKDIMPSL